MVSVLVYVAGMNDYLVNPCPVANYCPQASEPTLCPAGRMRPTVGAGQYIECMFCRPGYYCPNNTENVMGIPCRETYECPAGSALEADCRPGHYCTPITGLPPLCPGGYFCPNATGSNPYLCLYPYYCPPGSNQTWMCPLGYQALPHSQLRDSLSDSCLICPAGTYGNHTNRTVCETCPAGYYCPEGTGMGTSNPCPKGSYCPAGSGKALPCPTGRYGVREKAVSFEDCAQCPANTFQDVQGQSACNPCGSSAQAGVGQAVCSCMGKYRSFQTSDGACRCFSGYIYYDEADRNYTDTDSRQDCQPIVDTRCSAHHVRLAGSRECRDPITYDCSAACAGSTGILGEQGR